MKWILLCIALVQSPIDASRELYIFNERFLSVEQCKTYAMINSDEISNTVIPEIGPFAAVCVTEKVFEEQIVPGLQKEEETKANYI